MAFTSGIANGHLDLLERLVQFVTTNMLPAHERWTLLHSTSGPGAQRVLRGPGLAGTDRILVGIQAHTGTTFWNWELRGFVTWNPALPFHSQHLMSGGSWSFLALADFTLPFWIVANGRRIVLAVRVERNYVACHLGFFLPYGTPSQYPYPLLISANSNVGSNTPWQSLIHAGGFPFDSADVYHPGNHWTSASFFGSVWGGDINTNLDGSYPLLPFVVAGMGELQGCFKCPGLNLMPENLIRVGGVDHLALPNVHRSGWGDYWALRLE